MFDSGKGIPFSDEDWAAQSIILAPLWSSYNDHDHIQSFWLPLSLSSARWHVPGSPHSSPALHNSWLRLRQSYAFMSPMSWVVYTSVLSNKSALFLYLTNGRAWYSGPARQHPPAGADVPECQVTPEPEPWGVTCEGGSAAWGASHL